MNIRNKAPNCVQKNIKNAASTALRVLANLYKMKKDGKSNASYIKKKTIIEFVKNKTNPIIKKEGKLRLEQLIVSLRTTVDEGMINLDKIDNNYLTRLSGLSNYDRAYLSKTNEKKRF
mgnify:CR=1 FL=1